MARINFKETYGKRKTDAPVLTPEEDSRDNFTSRMAKELDRSSDEAKESKEDQGAGNTGNGTARTAGVKISSTNKTNSTKNSEAGPRSGQGSRAKAKSTGRENEADTIKKTSMNIRRSTLNYLATSARLAGVNQNDYLTGLIREAMKSRKEPTPDYSKAKTVRHESNTVVKAVQLKESDLAWLKRMAALSQKSISAYLDDLVEEKIAADKTGADGDKKGK